MVKEKAGPNLYQIETSAKLLKSIASKASTPQIIEIITNPRDRTSKINRSLLFACFRTISTTTRTIRKIVKGNLNMNPKSPTIESPESNGTDRASRIICKSIIKNSFIKYHFLRVTTSSYGSPISNIRSGRF